MTVELFALNSIMTLQGGNLANAPIALASAQMQVKQEMLTDSSDQLARRVDMNSHAYTFPLPYFAQQETQIQVASSASSLTVQANLTGFRAGEVKKIDDLRKQQNVPELPASELADDEIEPQDADEDEVD